MITRNAIIGIIFIFFGVFAAIAYLSIKLMIYELTGPMRQQYKESQKRAEAILSRIGVRNVTLSPHELVLAAHIIDPASLTTTWTDVAGLEEVTEEINNTVINPIRLRNLFNGSYSKLIQPPKGILLHGPPGCGKTMLAKAIAREVKARFLNVDVSTITNVWYGESQKLASAVFTLAFKIEPCIIFIDEIDTFLRSRNRQGNDDTLLMIKAEFMKLWDGLLTDPNCMVIVMGATNRPRDVDAAILRRMPSMFYIGLPNQTQRAAILNVILRNEDVSSYLDIEKISTLTDGFSGSDLKELCRNAAFYRITDYFQEEIIHERENLNDETPDKEVHQNTLSIFSGLFRILSYFKAAESESPKGDSESEIYHDVLRPIRMDDFMNALRKMLDSKVCAGIKLEPTTQTGMKERQLAELLRFI